MATKEPTQVTNADGSVTWTYYDAAGKVSGTYTVITNQDGTKTETRKDATGNTTAIFHKDTSGHTDKQATSDGNGNTIQTSFVPPGSSNSVSTTVNPDGTVLSRTTHDGPSGGDTTEYLNPDGTVRETASPEQNKAKDKQAADAQFTKQWQSDIPTMTNQGSGNLLTEPGALGAGIRAGANAVGDYINGPDKTSAATPAKNALDAFAQNLGKPDLTGGGLTIDGPPTATPKTPTPGAGGTPTVATATAAHIDAPPPITAGTVNPTTVTPTTITAGSVNAPTIADPGKITSGSVNAPTIALGDATKPDDITAQHIDRIMMDPSQTTESRDAMLKALSMAEGAANGTAPSAAQQLLQKAIDTNARQQLGAAGSLQGRSPGAALRSGQQGLMAANAASGADMAALRASEQATGRQQYGTFASSLYQNDISKSTAQLGADVDVAKTNAGLLLDAAKSNQTTALQTTLANMNKQLSVLQTNAQNALNAGEFNVAQSMQAQIENTKNTIDVAKSNAANELTARVTTMQAQLEAAKADQATALAAGQTNATNALNAQIAKMTADLEAAKSNLAAVTNTNIANATFAQNTGQFNAGETNKKALADQATGIQEEIIKNAKAQGLRDDQIKLLLAEAGFGFQQQGLDNTKNSANDASNAAYFAAIAKLIAAA